jgi:hypothetical protein
MTRRAKTLTLLLWLMAVATMICAVAMQWLGRDRAAGDWELDSSMPHTSAQTVAPASVATTQASRP